MIRRGGELVSEVGLDATGRALGDLSEALNAAQPQLAYCNGLYASSPRRG